MSTKGILKSIGSSSLPCRCEIIDMSKTGFQAQIKDPHGFGPLSIVEVDILINDGSIRCLAKPRRFLARDRIGFEIILIDRKNRETLNKQMTSLSSSVS